MIDVDTIYNEDCLETMAKMDDGAVDLVLTSPPYNMNLRIRNGQYCSRQIVKEFSTKYSDFDDNLPIDEFYHLHSKILHELLRVSSIVFYNISIVTGSKRAFFRIIGDFSDNIKDIIIWDKGSSQPAMHEGVLNRQTELLLVLENENNAISRQFQKCNFERGQLNDIWRITRGGQVDGSHSATFPEDLATKVVSLFTNEGDLVYDPFLGTGTTAVAATKLNRRYIGSEISPYYCEVAYKRICCTQRPLFLI